MSTFDRGGERPPAEGRPDDGELRGPAAPVACAYLRAKTAFGSLEPGAPDWQTGDDPTACYWCLATMSTAGPDDGLVHAHHCRAGRDCFESRD
jgi:hypothetical protein